MKSKFVFSISISLFIALVLNAQTMNPAAQGSDSMDVLSFRILQNFITSDGVEFKKWEDKKVTGEEHNLVVPIQTYPGSAAQMQNYSYDNFLPTVYNKEATQGSPFLLPSYVPGLVINGSYGVINHSNFLYNYDKMTGNLLLKKDNDPPIAVNRNQVNSFCLKEEKGGYIFMLVPLISGNEYLEVIHKGPRYSCYKLYKNKFINSNQKTNGYTTDGKTYDEYLDIETYYMVDENKKESYIFELTKKSIRKALGSESEKVEQYFKDHKYDEITETSVAQLLVKLNN